ncbi:MAG: UDP-N-acetylmuramate dehydrogenase [Acidimicrobiales bacterium]
MTGSLEDRLEAAAQSLAGLATRDAPLGARTTYRVGGRAAIGAEPRDEDGLLAVGAALRGHDLPVLVIGRGSNMLVSDRGFPGVAVFVGESFSELDVHDAVLVAGGGVSLPVAARRTAAAGLTGFEWAVGIPGSIGGAVRMNAGGHGADIAANLLRARVVPLDGGAPSWRAPAELALGYRRSNLRPCDVVTRAELQCAVGDRDAAEARISEIVRWRRTNQPGGQNAGSVFTNPEGDHAGRLVEAAGLKGRRIGSAEVSPKHANFIQSDEGGSADDVKALMDLVRTTVAARFGVDLRTEIRLIGFDGTYPREMPEGEGHA